MSLSNDLFQSLQWSLALSPASAPSSPSSSPSPIIPDALTSVTYSTQTPHEFLLMHFLSYLLKENNTNAFDPSPSLSSPSSSSTASSSSNRLFFICVKNSVAHYTHIAKKFSIQTQQLIDKNKLKFVNAHNILSLSSASPSFSNSNTAEEDYIKLLFSSSSTSDSTSTPSLSLSASSPFSLILNEIHSFGPNCNIIIDDIDSLSLMREKNNLLDFHYFLNNLLNYININNMNKLNNPTALVISSANDISSSSSASSLIHSFSSSHSSLSIDLSPLRTGKSNEIDGIMKIIKRDPTKEIQLYELALHYKVNESNLLLLNKGQI